MEISSKSKKSASLAVAAGSIIGAIITPLAIFAAVLSSGAGHGSYIAAKLAFPWSLLLSLLTNLHIGIISIIIGLIQFPVYGALLGWSLKRKNYALLSGVTIAHIVAVIICFSGVLPNFS